MKLIKEIGLKGKTKSKYGLYECICGNLFETQISRVKGEFTKSCGCLKNKKSSERMKQYNIKHNATGTRLHTIWLAMKKRCTTHKSYINVEMCNLWLDFINFQKWSLENGYKDNLKIDRIDNNGNYEPNNCRWVESQQQQNNKLNSFFITIDGSRKTLAEWAKINKANKQTLYSQFYRMFDTLCIINSSHIELTINTNKNAV